jgi:hypothetical protein
MLAGVFTAVQIEMYIKTILFIQKSKQTLIRLIFNKLYIVYIRY